MRKLKTELKKYRGKDDDEIDIEEEEKLRKQLAQKEELSTLLHEQLKVCFFLCGFNLKDVDIHQDIQILILLLLLLTLTGSAQAIAASVQSTHWAVAYSGHCHRNRHRRAERSKWYVCDHYQICAVHI